MHPILRPLVKGVIVIQEYHSNRIVNKNRLRDNCKGQGRKGKAGGLRKTRIESIGEVCTRRGKLLNEIRTLAQEGVT